MAIFCLENSYFYHTQSKIIILVIHARRLEVIVAAKGKRLDGLRYATVMWPKPMIDDATAKIKEINKVKEELKWKDIEKTWDEQVVLLAVCSLSLSV